MLTARDLKFFNALNSVPGVGAATLRILQNNFGSFEEAWQAKETILGTCNLPPLALRALLWKRPSLNPDKEIEKLIKNDIWLIAEDDEYYPPPLKEIPNPPLALYGRGARETLPVKNNKSVYLGVVGTRRPTAYGLEATEKIVHELVSYGFTVISGLATGIDARAHEAVLDMGGKTIAVLGSGLDQDSIFPPENRGLARRIANSHGTVISEYAPGTPAVKEHFPMRNRIISGLSRGVLVAEARERSGALITARLALEQNRDVFAIPGSVFSPTSQGPHLLIQEGAKLVRGVADILEEYGMTYNEKGGRPDSVLGSEEELLVEILKEPQSVDFLKEKTGLATAAIVSTLSLLELKGLIKNLGGDTYQKV